MATWLLFLGVVAGKVANLDLWESKSLELSDYKATFFYYPQ